MENFRLSTRVGVGAHGSVFKATDLRDQTTVALKKIEINNINAGLPNNTLREICALRQLKSRYVVQLKEVTTIGTAIVLVMEYLECSLADILRNTIDIIPLPIIKQLTSMILNGVKDIHDTHLMHRDLKPANLLISNRGLLKIADFGLARIYNPIRKRILSHQVATRWYRAPELLYGSRNYTPSIDMWAVGCIVGEMLNNQALFRGETDIEQLAIVLTILGSPDETTWPGLTELPDYNKISFVSSQGRAWTEIIPSRDAITLDFIQNILCYNMDKRLKPQEALNHPFFYTKPSPNQDNHELLKLVENTKNFHMEMKDFDEIIDNTRPPTALI